MIESAALDPDGISPYDLGRVGRTAFPGGWSMVNRIEALRAVIGAYQDEREVAASRLEHDENHRGQIELARELLVEHGESHVADQLKVELQVLDQRIGASRQTIARIDDLIATYRSSLDRIHKLGAG